MSLDPASLVSSFRALPRRQLVPSGSAPNFWHFSIRQVPLSPPGAVLFLVNPPSEYVHVEGPLPEAFHMESLAIRANIVTLLLLKAFVSGLGNSVQMGRPWEWMTDDAEMAGAIGECLRGMGIRDGLDAMKSRGDQMKSIGRGSWRNCKGPFKPTESHNDLTEAQFLNIFWVADKNMLLDLLMALLGSNVDIKQYRSFTPASSFSDNDDSQLNTVVVKLGMVRETATTLAFVTSVAS
ncbi:MAG: hypothetical protein LQ352_004343 [Teloschistes flavicans]|nr:MAG: hypothetical protein LQ352_004343 [Teloschistes flavicans]